MTDKLYRDDEADARMARTPSLPAYLPRILLYPLSGFCLPVLLLASIAMDIGVRSMMGISLISIVGGWTVYYLVSIIAHSAQGHATPPPMSGDAMHMAGARTLGALLLPALIATAHARLAAGGHGAAATAILIIGLMALPANFLALATTGEAAAAMNPLGWLQIIAALGPAYFLVALALTLSALVPMQLDNPAGFAVATFGTCYVAFMSAHLLGYLAYHRHERLGLDVRVRDPDVVAREREQARRLQTLLARIADCLQRGDQAGAQREILAEPGGPANVLQFHDELFSRLLTQGTPALIHQQGRRYVELLLNANRTARALEIYETCVRRHPGFEPQTPLQVEQLARQALAQDLDALFAQLTAGLETRFPGDPVQVDCGLMGARYWSQQRNDDEKARALLKPLLAHKQHPRYAQVLALARTLAKLDRM